MATLVLVIFPEMDTTKIERFRGRWDPLAAVVPAHITVAYPFEWPGSLSDLADILATMLASWLPFPLELAEPTIWEEEYLFVLLNEGREQVQQLHESICGLALPGLRRPASFVPHMTVGRRAQSEALAVAVQEAGEMSLPLVGIARSLSVYCREGDGRRVRELDMPFVARS